MINRHPSGLRRLAEAFSPEGEITSGILWYFTVKKNSGFSVYHPYINWPTLANDAFGLTQQTGIFELFAIMNCSDAPTI
jgi:hypothetical protein